MNRPYGALSGVAIVLIVLNHAIEFGLPLAPVAGPLRGALIVLQALGVVAVPAFLFISGSFMSYSASRLSLTFIKNSFDRILWPYVIWSVVFYVLIFLIEGTRFSAPGYVKNLLVGYPYHFVPLLVFWYLAAPILVGLGRKHMGLVLIGVGLVQALLIVERFPEMFGLQQLLPAPLARFVRVPILFTPMSDWAIYFPLGLLISMHDAWWRPYLVRLRWLTLGGAVTLFVLGILNAFHVVFAPWARLVVPVPLMFFLPTVTRSSIPLLRFFENLGKRSYGVYLSHFVVISAAAFVVGNLQLPPGLRVVVYPFFFVLALGTPLLLMDLMARAMAVRRLYRYIFGIVPPPAMIMRQA